MKKRFSNKPRETDIKDAKHFIKGSVITKKPCAKNLNGIIKNQ